ncbi:MAG: metallophosphoesterase, partial [Verrucomicrobia bacterium]|nr:metallophosphoesterase [Verrucomicrobiota bacterium]
MKKQILKTTLALFAAAAGMTLTVGAAETPTNELTSYQQLIQTKKTLRFHEDGTFKMLFFSDIHGGGDHLPELVITNIQTLVARENPDFVFFDGDNHWGHNITEESLRSCLKDMVGYIESRNIPWAHVYGNHDSEHKDSISRPEQQKVYESFEWCVSKAGDENVSGVGNYILPVLEHNSDKIAFNIWALDSGDYISNDLKKQIMPVKSLFEGYRNSSYA